MSFIAKEECIDSPYTIVHGSQVPNIKLADTEFAGRIYSTPEDPGAPIIDSKILVIGKWDGQNGNYSREGGLKDHLLGTG